METKYHCQICEREIKARLGIVKNAPKFSTEVPARELVIAHHGYQRPGDGWQTPSCYGARHLPYEVSNDAMAPYIHMVQSYQNGRRSALYTFKNEPPKTMTVKKGWGLTAKDLMLERPEGFDPKANEESYEATRPWSYQYEYRSHVHLLESEIRNSQREINRMTKRLAEWKPAK